MKKIFIIKAIIWFASYASSMGQCQEDIEIKTHPSNAVNDELDENHPVQSLYIPPLLVPAPSIRGLSPTSISHK